MAQQATAPTSGMALSGPDNAASRTFMNALVTSPLVLNDLALAMRSICSRYVVMPRQWPIGTGRQIRMLA